MAFKTSAEMMEMCRALRERSGMTQTEWGATLDPPASRGMITYAETAERSQFDAIRVRILEQKGGYVVTPGFDLTRGK